MTQTATPYCNNLPQSLVVRLERVDNDGAEIWVDIDSHQLLLANLTRLPVGDQIVGGQIECRDWWNISTSNAVFAQWVKQCDLATVLTPESGKKLAEDFVAYLLGLKHLLAVLL